MGAPPKKREGLRALTKDRDKRAAPRSQREGYEKNRGLNVKPHGEAAEQSIS